MLTLFTRSFQQSQVCLTDGQPDDTRHTEAERCEAETFHQVRDAYPHGPLYSVLTASVMQGRETHGYPLPT